VTTYTRMRRFVVDACDGPFGSAIASEHYTEKGARVIRLGNIGSAEWLDEDRAFIGVDYWRSLRRHHAAEGDLVVAALGDQNNPVGRATAVPNIGPALVKADCHRLRLHPDADPRFLSYYLSSDRGRYEAGRMADGSTRKRLTLGKTLGLPVPDFPGDEQRAIADFLGDETAHIDALIAKKRALADLLDEREAGVVEAAIRALAIEHGEAPLRHFAPRILVGIVVTPAAYYTDHGVPALRGINVKRGRLDLADLVHLSPAGDALHRKSRLSAGDVVIVRTGQAGAACVVPAELDGSNCVDLLIVRRSPHFLPTYLEFVLNSDWTSKHIAEHSVGTIQSHFNVAALKGLLVPVPPLETQAAVVESLTAETQLIRRVRVTVSEQLGLLIEHRQAIITAAVTGELKIPGVAA
jgi:type I restriction enzyme S subunit